MRPKNTSQFHLGIRDLETGLLKANPLIRSEMIGSDVQLAAWKILAYLKWRNNSP